MYELELDGELGHFAGHEWRNKPNWRVSTVHILRIVYGSPSVPFSMARCLLGSDTASSLPASLPRSEGEHVWLWQVENHWIPVDYFAPKPSKPKQDVVSNSLRMYQPLV